MNREILRQLIIEALTDAEKDQLYSKRDNEEELKKAYKKLLRKYHPDRAGDSEEDKTSATETTQEINNIYDELANKPTMTYEEPQGSKRTSQSQGSSDGFDWNKKPDEPSEFSDKELVNKIKDSSTISGNYGFQELYVEFLKRQDKGKAKAAAERFNTVNMKTFEKPSDILKKENYIAHFRVAIGNERKHRVSFDCIYKSLRMFQETSRILSSDGLSGLSKALEAYKIGAQYSPLKITSQGRDEIKKSVEAFEEIVSKLSFLKRLKYMWLGAKKEEKEEMKKLINKVSSLNSSEAFGWQLHKLILK